MPSVAVSTTGPARLFAGRVAELADRRRQLLGAVHGDDWEWR